MQSVYSTVPVDWLQDTLWRSLTPLQKCSRRTLQPQSTGPLDTRWGSLTPLQKCSRCILQSQSTGYRTLFGGVFPPCRNAVGIFYSPSLLVHRTLVGGVLPPCWNAVGVFYSPSLLGHRTLVRGGGLTPLQKCSRCILQPQPTRLCDFVVQTEHPILVRRLGLVLIEKKSTYRLVDLAGTANYKMKIKDRQILDRSQRTEKPIEYEADSDTNNSWHTWNTP